MCQRTSKIATDEETQSQQRRQLAISDSRESLTIGTDEYHGYLLRLMVEALDGERQKPGRLAHRIDGLRSRVSTGRIQGKEGV